MKSKKADIRISHFIGGVIAIIVLVVIALYLYSSTDTFKNFFSWIGFNMTTEPISGIGIVRYDISTAKVMHYDGTEWQEFEELKFGDKTIKSSSLKEDFENWYYETERDKKIVKINIGLYNLLRFMKDDNGNSMGSSLIDFVVKQSNAEASVNDLRVNAQIRSLLRAGDFKKGILIDLIKMDNNERIINAGHFILKENDILVYRYMLANGGTNERSFFVSTSKSGNTIKNIFEEARNWRDSVFVKPVPITNEKDTKYYCPQLWDNKFAVVYLDKEVGKDAKCKEVKTGEVKDTSLDSCYLASEIKAYFYNTGIKPLPDSYQNIEENEELTNIIIELSGTCDEIPKFIEIFQVDESENNIKKVYDSEEFTPDSEGEIVFSRTIGEEGLYKIIIYCPNKPSESGCRETAKEGDKWAWARYFKIKGTEQTVELSSFSLERNYLKDDDVKNYILAGDTNNYVKTDFFILGDKIYVKANKFVGWVKKLATGDNKIDLIDTEKENINNLLKEQFKKEIDYFTMLDNAKIEGKAIVSQQQ